MHRQLSKQSDQGHEIANSIMNAYNDSHIPQELPYKTKLRQLWLLAFQINFLREKLTWCVIPAESIKEKLTGGNEIDLLRYLFNS